MSNKKPKYIVTAVSCSDCGSDKAVDCFEEKPTLDEKKNLCNSIGGMICITINVFQLKNNIYEAIE